MREGGTIKETIIDTMTKAKGRKSLYHFTRTSNLPAIAHFDALWSSSRIHPQSAGLRRTEPHEMTYDAYSITINQHLKIAERMIDVSTTLSQFRACLDRHVFFWPTLQDCLKMLATYTRREPDASFAVLEFDAYALLAEHYNTVKLSKYDSGSSPRYPAHCTYRKSPDMFLPIDQFQSVANGTVPAKASEIREVLIEDHVSHVSSHLRTVYADPHQNIPHCWSGRTKPLAELQLKAGKGAT